MKFHSSNKSLGYGLLVKFIVGVLALVLALPVLFLCSSAVEVKYICEEALLS